MVNRLNILILVGLLLATALSTKAQDTNVATQPVKLQVAGSALVAVFGPPVVLQLAGAKEAGDSISTAAENDLTRLRISSLVQDNELRSITARLSEELVGTQLLVDLKNPNANFKYPLAKGELKGPQVLSNESDAVLVEGIGTCWSGRGEDDGYVIKYVYKAIQGAPILKGSDVTITYTITLVPSDARE
ncbi:MAG: hypothetical protein GXY09_04840 [Bacteroidales bacterium]|nr:hypothetical protein [Bacteroidales bacterium]